ncbi:MAG TPA: hypothetical protein VFX89_18345, partial [Gammaproteobacteria bacterium]|nr:hypothetical protein [Gammaproteobacteria bacterium]
MRRSTPLLFAAILTAASPPAGAAYRVYVTNEGSGTLSVIDGDTHAVATLPIGKRPRGLTA